MNPSSDIYQGLHILLVTDDDVRGKALTKVLRDHQARVGDLKTGARDPAALRGIDLAIIDGRYQAAAEARLSEMRGDVRARFASVVTVDFEALIRGDGSVLLNTLTEQVAPLVEVDRKLTERAKTEPNFSGSLAPLGPSRTLRALSMSGHTLLVELRHPTLQASVEVSNELLVSASAARAEKRWEAWSALVRILGLSEAEVLVSRRSFTSAMNIMEPVDQALEVAAQERHCSAPSIAEEEAEALRVSLAPAARAAGIQVGATRDSLPPRGASLNPGYTPPRPPGKPVAQIPLQQRTLLGIRPGLPSLSAPPVANDTAASLAPASAAALQPEAPRYAHRPGAIGNQRPGMTLLGVAPGSIPGLAEMRAQNEAEQAAKAKAKVDAEVHKALAQAATEVALPPVQPMSAPSSPAPAQHNKVERPRERSAFDPPTGRMVVGDQLLDTLNDIDDLDDLSDELSMAASPLSTPLPPPREAAPAGSRNDDLDDEEDSASEPPREALTERAPRPSQEDLLSETFPTPTDLRSQLLAHSGEALAKTERPPAPSAEIDTSPGKHSAFDDPPTRNYPVGMDATVLDTGSQAAETPNAPGDVTLVTKREPEARKSRVGMLSAAAVLLGLVGLLVHAALRDRDQVSATPAVANTTSSAAASPTPTPPASAAAVAPVIAAGPPASAAGPADEPATAEPSAPSTAPVGSPLEVAPSAAQASAEAPVAAPAPVVEEPVPAPPSAASSGTPAAAPVTADLAELLKQAQRLLAERDVAAARPLFEQGLTLDAANPHVRAGLGETLLKLNEPALALPQAQAAVKLRPKRARYQVLLGDVLSALGKLDDAQTAWKKALTLDPADVEAKQRLAR